MATRRFLISLLFSCLLGSAASAQMPDWWVKVQKVKMRTDAREDVVKLFGEPDDTHQEPSRFATYYFGDYTVTFLFTMETCRISWSVAHGWNVPALRVEDITVYPQKKPRPEDHGIGQLSDVKFADLKLDLTDLDKEPAWFSDSDPGGVKYFNDEKGVVFLFHGDGRLFVMGRNPTAAQKQDLRCAPNQEWDK